MFKEYKTTKKLVRYNHNDGFGYFDVDRLVYFNCYKNEINLNFDDSATLILEFDTNDDAKEEAESILEAMKRESNG